MPASESGATPPLASTPPYRDLLQNSASGAHARMFALSDARVRGMHMLTSQQGSRHAHASLATGLDCKLVGVPQRHGRAAAALHPPCGLSD